MSNSDAICRPPTTEKKILRTSEGVLWAVPVSKSERRNKHNQLAAGPKKKPMDPALALSTRLITVPIRHVRARKSLDDTSLPWFSSALSPYLAHQHNIHEYIPDIHIFYSLFPILLILLLAILQTPLTFFVHAPKILIRRPAKSRLLWNIYDSEKVAGC